MLPETIEQMLKNYRPYVGRVEYLKKAVEAAEKEIKAWKAELAEDMAWSSGQKMDGMPRGTTVGHPTERIALMLATGYMPEDLKAAEESLNAMNSEINEDMLTIVFVEAWVQGLSQKDRWIIERYYFEGSTYNEIADAYDDQFGVAISREGIRRMRRDAFNKICDMAK